MEETNKTSNHATIALKGPQKTEFEAIRQHIVEAIPGVNPSNSDVLRFALHVAAEKLSST